MPMHDTDLKRFSGVIPPVIIPLKGDRTLDREAFKTSIDRMIDAGVTGLFFLGSSGEVVFLTDEQRMEVLEVALEIVDGRVPVLVGVIDMETMRVIDQAKRVSKLPIDALVATAPFYALGGPHENERHFRQIREHTDLPLFAYDLPVSVHTKLQPEMLMRLGRDGVIQGVKDSSGHEVVVDGALLGGADGSVPGLANIDPASYVEQWKATQAGDWEKVAKIQDHLARLMMMTRKVTATVGFGAGVGAFKTALWQMGVFNTNQMREPVQALTGDDVRSIVHVLRAQGLIPKDSLINFDWD